MEKCKDDLQREFYIQMTKRYGWTKRILTNFIEAQTYEKYLLNQTNFDLTLPVEQRVQAKLAVKDEYTFDFAELSPEYSEHELEMQLVNNIRAFLIEMGGDYRLDDPLEYEKWYGVKHTSLEYLKEAVYGLPEINKDKIKEARVLANPGCYATASSLGLLPIINAGLCDTKTIVVDGKSGTSGAGRGASVDNIFSEINENFKAYKVGCHRHTPEIEQVLNTKSKSDVKLTFVPQLVPMTRGILITAYVDLTSDIKEEEIFDLYKDFYKDAKFVEVVEEVPQTKWSKNTNMAYISVRKDERTNKLIIISVIDNLVKGAAGQGIQNMNIMFGIPEDTGLGDLAVLP